MQWKTEGSSALDGKRVVVTGASYDRFTQEDVVHYHEDIAMMKKRKASEGEDALWLWEREMCRHDLYYLLLYVLDIKVMYYEETDDEIIFRPWIFNRCWEVQRDPDYHVDIWAREHFKSTIITLGKTIQDILIDPEVTIGLFSYNVNIAETFVRQIRTNLESVRMRNLFPDIIPDETSKGKYKTRDKDGNEHTVKFSWSDQKFTVKRTSKKKEPTVSGYGLINAQPTGMHFDILVYDDVVTPASVLTQTQNDRTTQQWQMSLNTGRGEGVRVRIIGTRYALRDTYFHILNPHYKETGKTGGSAYKLRCYPCENDGVPVLYTEDYIKLKRMSMIGYVFSSQMMCDPQDTGCFRFLEEWIPRRIRQSELLETKERYNWYIIVDPAYTKTNRSDFTSMDVIGTGSDARYRFADLIRDKLTLTEKVDRLFSLVRKWQDGRNKPTVFYEANSASSDIVAIEERMKKEDYFFTIIPVTTKPKLKSYAISGAPLKANRIMALEPLFREKRIVLVEDAIHVNSDGNEENMMQSFIDNEYLSYPFSDHDDTFDALSRIADLEVGIQMTFPDGDVIEEEYFRKEAARRNVDVTQRGYNPY